LSRTVEVTWTPRAVAALDEIWFHAARRDPVAVRVVHGARRLQGLLEL
jgi:plasmid stabilization system protein ParE